MASNDMNSWDDDPDELLRRRWQETFEDFEVKPRSSLSRRILNQLPAGRRRRPIRWLAAGLLLFISVGLLYQVRFSERPDSSGSLNTSQPVAPNRPFSSSRDVQPTASAERPPSAKPARTSSRSGAVPASQWPTVHQPTDHRMETAGGSTLQVALSPVETQANLLPTQQTDQTEQLAAGKVPLRKERRRTFRGTPTLTGQSLSKAPRTTSNRLSDELVGPVRNDWSEPVQAPADGPAGQHTLSDPSVVTNYSSVSPLQFLRLAGSLSLPSHLSALPDQLPATNSTSRYLAEHIVVRPVQRWFIEAVPLSSFQWMSALPASAGYLSQVHAPAAFSPATLGYQVNGGLYFGRWQAHLSIGQLRRWAYYTVNENRYRVEPNPANPYHLVREAYTVAENVALPMVGAGLSQYQLLGQGRYAVEMGGQVSYLPTSRQTLLGLRGGASRRLPLSHHMELQAGVTVEYGLNRLLSEQRQLAIHPVVVGLNVRIQPRLRQP